MSSIHEIARNDGKYKEIKSSEEEYCMLPDSQDAVDEEDYDEDLMMAKPQESIREEFRIFEKSINQIDTKFNLLNTNLDQYQAMNDSARRALQSRENATSRRRQGDASSGFPTDRISEAPDSSALNIEDMSNNAS